MTKKKHPVELPEGSDHPVTLDEILASAGVDVEAVKASLRRYKQAGGKAGITSMAMERWVDELWGRSREILAAIGRLWENEV